MSSSPDKPFHWEKNEFDTEILGFQVAKIHTVEADDFESAQHNVAQLVQDMQSNDVIYAVHRTHANNFPIIHALEKAGFLLVDGLASLNADISQIPGNAQVEGVELAQKTDWNALISLASEVFFLNRLYNDPYIKLEKAKKFYGKWMENSLNGNAADGVLVYREGRNIAGFATYQINGHIPLIGVSDQYRGKGIAKKLTGAVLIRLREMGIKKSEIETQIGNVPALRAYQSQGFKLENCFLTFRWKK